MYSRGKAPPRLMSPVDQLIAFDIMTQSDVRLSGGYRVLGNFTIRYARTSERPLDLAVMAQPAWIPISSA